MCHSEQLWRHVGLACWYIGASRKGEAPFGRRGETWAEGLPGFGCPSLSCLPTLQSRLAFSNTYMHTMLHVVSHTAVRRAPAGPGRIRGRSTRFDSEGLGVCTCPAFNRWFAHRADPSDTRSSADDSELACLPCSSHTRTPAHTCTLAHVHLDLERLCNFREQYVCRQAR